MSANPATNSMPIARNMFTTPFSYRRVIFAVIVSIAMGCLTVLAQTAEQQALGAFYYGAREYNLITFGDYTTSGGDTWGAVAVGGDYYSTTTTNLSQYWQPHDSNRSNATDPSALIAGTIYSAVTETNVQAGIIAINKNRNSGAEFKAQDQILYLPKDASGGEHKLVPRSSPRSFGGENDPFANYTKYSSIVQFSTLRDKLISAQDTLFELGNKSINQVTAVDADGGKIRYKIDVTAKGVSYLNMKTSDFSGKDLTAYVPDGSALVINLTVDSNTFAFNKFTANYRAESQLAPEYATDANRILWNVIFDSSTPISANSLITPSNIPIFGSFLAPKGTIVGNGTIFGQVIANSFTQNNVELHQALFAVDMALVPEPSTIALGMGTLALGFVFWRRRQQRQQLQK